MAIMGTQGSAAVKPIENSPKGSQLQKLGSFTSLDDRFPSTPLPVVVQGRKGGFVNCCDRRNQLNPMRVRLGLCRQGVHIIQDLKGCFELYLL